MNFYWVTSSSGFYTLFAWTDGDLNGRSSVFFTRPSHLFGSLEKLLHTRTFIGLLPPPPLLIPVIIGGQDSVAFQYSVGSTEAEHEGASVDISRTNSGGGDIDDGRLKRFVSPMVPSVLSGQVIFIENILLSLDPKTASFTAEIRSSCPLSSSPCVHPMIVSFLKCS